MGLYEILKRNYWINALGKKVNIYKAFLKDAIEFSNSYIEVAKTNEDFRYSIMLLVHSLEKGMSMPNPRPFGHDKVKELMKYLKSVEGMHQNNFEYRLGLSVLKSWFVFFTDHGWEGEENYNEVMKFINEREISNIPSGIKEYHCSCVDLSDKYQDVVFSRHSVRNFKEEKLDMNDVKFAIDCFIETPTACNRQMCGLLYIEKPEVKDLLDKRVIGLSGFNIQNTQYFVITYDLAAFAYSGERQQGLFNAGLCATNFINGLHAKGIGSCCLQWSNKYSEDIEVRKALGLKNSERIGIVIGCGYYIEKNIIPCSTRKTKEDIFRII